MKALLINGSPHNNGNTALALTEIGKELNKPGAAVAVCRRSGDTATLDRLNKYFTINNMPLATSQYWNGVHGTMPGEAAQDKEGMQIMRTLSKNLAWLMKNTHGKETPQPEPTRARTNFIR